MSQEKQPEEFNLIGNILLEDGEEDFSPENTVQEEIK